MSKEGVMSELAMPPLAKLVLEDLHIEFGARLVPFAGYNMPVQYNMGVMAEHLHCRTAVGFFDVSHMGQVLLYPKNSMIDLGLALERLMPVDVLGLAPWRQRYGLLTTCSGGLLDDLMFANRGDHFLMVVNASRKTEDMAHLIAELSNVAHIALLNDRALFALQGPLAAHVLLRLIPDIGCMHFMDCGIFQSCFGAMWISRSGYTGEDGFEISIVNNTAQDFARALLAMPEVAPIGLGARDSLRLEAGLCLYGHEIDLATSPIEAGLIWAIPKSRRPSGERAGGFLGDTRILQEIAAGPARKRVGLRPQGRAPMRDGTMLYSLDGAKVGSITSGGFGPSLQAPIAMGLVDAHLNTLGMEILGDVRGKKLPVQICSFPFYPTNYLKRS
ncbi:MAG: aminomethyltransferase [Paracoccaceae bacterium]|jgi:aminomethyltransferase